MVTKRERTIIKYGGLCQMCGKQTNNSSLNDLAEIDHLIPKSAGGTGKETNLSLLCGFCNRKKSNKYGKDFLNGLIIKNKESINEYDLMQIHYELKNGLIKDKEIEQFKKEVLENTLKIFNELSGVKAGVTNGDI